MVKMIYIVIRNSIDNKLFIGTKYHALELSEVQIEGKKRMLTKDFLKGNPYIEMCSILWKQ